MTEATETDFSDGQSLSYARAVEELEAILDELEDDNLDVDRLAQRVGRAATLIRLCRERIGHTRLEVERIVADLDAATPTPPDDQPPYREG
ncbi:hypothetical protein BH24ACT2_BH24ACT2_13320 [soil metagenome]